ncbi:MAG: sporulation protein YunB [Firmicutes bacterium]|nr:sporulation protein YunB [Bacillota bacterium]
MCVRLPIGWLAPNWLVRFVARVRRRPAVRRPGLRAQPRGRRVRSRAGPRRGTRGGRVRRLLMVCAALGIALGAGAFMIVETRLKPTLLEIAEARARIIATNAVNTALSEEIALDIKYEDLMAWRTDGQGNVVAVQPNTGEISRIAAVTTIRVQQALRAAQREKISVPLGQVLGSSLLASMGPWITATILPIGTVNTSVTDFFETAGINQLRHRIYLEIEAYVKIVVPLVSASVVVNTSMPIAEAIILGDVPQFYVNIENAGSLLKSILGVGEGAEQPKK